MEWLVLLLLIFVFLLVLLFIIALKVRLVCNTENNAIGMWLIWLEPLIKAFVTVDDSIPVMEVYLFDRRIFKKRLKSSIKSIGKQKGWELVKLSNPKDVNINLQYGFRDPFTTGIACGAVNMASQLINIDSMVHKPDFLALRDYIYLDATAKVNIGSAFVRLLRFRKNGKIRV
mgnify:CR=1 FL=1